MNYILGSGLIGKLCKFILGDGWEIISYNKSRYYSFDPPLADNYIQHTDKTNDIISKLLSNVVPIYYKTPISYSGQLIYNVFDNFIDEYIEKVYAGHSYASKLIKTDFMAYDCAFDLNKKLSFTLENDIKNNMGIVSKIDCNSNVLEFIDSKKNSKILEFDKIISTIPLDVLCNIVHFGDKKLDINLSSNDCYYYLIHNNSKIDLEDANGCYIVDKNIDFHYCNYIGMNKYLFRSVKNIENIYNYIGLMIGYDFEILDSWVIPKSIPKHNPPDLSIFGDNIFCIGSNAQWDDFMDISSCIHRIFDYEER